MSTQNEAARSQASTSWPSRSARSATSPATTASTSRSASCIRAASTSRCRTRCSRSTSSSTSRRSRRRWSSSSGTAASRRCWAWTSSAAWSSCRSRYRAKKEIRNTLQTNAMRLDDEWCAFFKENDFFIGVSLDGPQEIHDRYRKDRKGEGTFDRVMAGVRLLQKHGVEFNALACVGRETAHQPLEVYRFFKDAGIRLHPVHADHRARARRRRPRRSSSGWRGRPCSTGRSPTRRSRRGRWSPRPTATS